MVFKLRCQRVHPVIIPISYGVFFKTPDIFWVVNNLIIFIRTTPPPPKEYCIVGIQPLGRFGQRSELTQPTGMALVRCILGNFLDVACHCFPPSLDVPTFATRYLHVRHNARDPSGGRWNCGRECCPVILPKWRLPRHLRIFYRDDANLRHGTDGFTFPPKEGVLRIFSPLKIRRLRPGLNPRTWVLNANTLPLDHWSRAPTSTFLKIGRNLAVYWQFKKYNPPNLVDEYLNACIFSYFHAWLRGFLSSLQFHS